MSKKQQNIHNSTHQIETIKGFEVSKNKIEVHSSCRVKTIQYPYLIENNIIRQTYLAPVT